MTDVAELLDTLAPPYEGTGDWNRVLRDAKLERRPLWRPYRLAAVAALVAVIAGAVALWPASNGTGGSVLDRALAATGEGQVLHLVYEGELPSALVDLETGERTEVRSQHEVWFDPAGGPPPDRDLRRRRAVRHRPRPRRDAGARDLHLLQPGRRLPGGARVRAGRGRRRGHRRRDGRLLDPHRGRPRRRRVPRHVRADLHPRHPERDAGPDSDRHLRDRRARLGPARRGGNASGPAGRDDRVRRRDRPGRRCIPARTGARLGRVEPARLPARLRALAEPPHHGRRRSRA